MHFSSAPELTAPKYPSRDAYGGLSRSPLGRPDAPAGTRRLDIQALRGIAVLYVVIYHANFGVLTHGFLGVDIFFVISGYLITGMICRDIDAGRFRIAEFYWRRAKRLLPATYVVLLVVALLSYLTLLPLERADTVAQLLGSLTFTANVVLWRQSGYFDVAAYLKPLLHMWSLSLEEQFYLLLPPLLVIVPARVRNKTILALLILSLGLCFAAATNQSNAAFYLLPMRAWELLIGSFGAIWADRELPRKAATSIGLAALGVIVLLPFGRIDSVHPRFDALAICVATLLVLKLRPHVLQDNRIALALGKVGDISFSLYLIHWPLLVFARQILSRTLPTGISILLVLLSITLAATLFRWIENPIHRSAIRPRVSIIAGTVAASLAILAILAIPTAHWTAHAAATALRRANFGFGSSCDYGASFSPEPECRNRDNPQIVVWGDSLAMHLVPGLAAADPGLGVIQATRHACGPLLGVASSAGDAPQTCIEFNDSVRTYLERSPGIRYVILSSTFFQYLGRNRLLIAGGERVSASLDLAERFLGDTVSAMRAMGKKTVIVAPPPSQDFNIGLCTERLAAGFWTWPSDCRISVASYRQRNSQVISLLENTSRKYDVSVIWLSDHLCDSENCKVSQDGVPIYVDDHHLSQPGSVAIFKAFDLFNRIVEVAR